MKPAQLVSRRSDWKTKLLCVFDAEQTGQRGSPDNNKRDEVRLQYRPRQEDLNTVQASQSAGE